MVLKGSETQYDQNTIFSRLQLEVVLKGSETQYDQNDCRAILPKDMFLRVEKIGKRKKKEVDAKHLLFLWGEWTAKQC